MSHMRQSICSFVLLLSACGGNVDPPAEHSQPLECVMPDGLTCVAAGDATCCEVTPGDGSFCPVAQPNTCRTGDAWFVLADGTASHLSDDCDLGPCAAGSCNVTVLCRVDAAGHVLYRSP